MHDFRAASASASLVGLLYFVHGDRTDPVQADRIFSATQRMSQFANRCSLGEPRLAACVRVAESFISSLAPAHGHTYVRIYSHTVRARSTGTQMNERTYSESIDTHQYNHITSTDPHLLKLKVISRFNS